MCDSVHGGVCLSACWDTPLGADTPSQEQTPPDQADPPWSRHPRQTPPKPDTPQARHSPRAQSMLGDTVSARAVRILLECNLVSGMLRLRSHLSSMSPFFVGAPLFFFMDTLMDRMGVQTHFACKCIHHDCNNVTCEQNFRSDYT